MLKFRPIVYGENDLRAFKYTGPTATQEGRFCYIAASSSLNIVTATPYSGTTPATMTNTGGGTLLDRKKYFPVYKENPDVESIAATINQNDYVVGFAMTAGNEFEVHKSMTESGYATTWGTVGGYAVLGSTGKLTPAGALNATKLVVGICTGTFNSTWIRVRVN